MSSSSNKDQQSIEMKQKRTANKSIGTLMSFGATHDKYTKGIDITQVGTFCSALYSSKGFIIGRLFRRCIISICINCFSV